MGRDDVAHRLYLFVLVRLDPLFGWICNPAAVMGRITNPPQQISICLSVRLFVWICNPDAVHGGNYIPV